MSELRLLQDKHVYVKDGIEVPSVSELTRFLANEVYKNPIPELIEAAAERGTKVHTITESLDTSGTCAVNEEELVPYVRAYVNFLHDHNVRWDKIEWAVSKDYLYAGTIDRYGTLDGERVIMDIKTTGTIGNLHKVLYTAAQNLYRMAIEDSYKVESIYILQLKKDETYKLIKLEKSNTLAEACITLHEATKKKRRKKHG